MITVVSRFSYLVCLFVLALPFLNPGRVVAVDTFRVTTDSSQQKDALVYQNTIAYTNFGGSQGIDIWGYNLVSRENFPIIQRDGQQFLTDFYRDLVVYQDISPGEVNGDIRLYNLRTGMDSLIIGGPNSYSSGGTNGRYLIYLDGGACGNLYLYNLSRQIAQHLADSVCTPQISNNIVYWGINTPSGTDIRGYDLTRGKFLDLVTQDGFQSPYDMYNYNLVYVDSDGGGFGSNQAIRVKNVFTKRVKTLYETNTNSLNWPSISNRYVVWSEAPLAHVNSIKAADLRTGEVFIVQEPGPHQNSHTFTSIWKDTAAWMSWRTGNGDIYASLFSRK